MALAACKHKGEQKTSVPEDSNTAEVAKPAETQVTEESPPRDMAQPDTFRVVISMISIGEGTDPEGPAKVDRVLKQWEAKYGRSVDYTVQPWGREGEADYNFMLRGMTKEQQEEFITLLQSGLKDERLILVTENKANRFRR